MTQIDRTIVIHGENNQFYDFYDARYSYPIYEAVKDCHEMNMKWLSMPELIQAKIDEPIHSRIWEADNYLTRSIKATGRGKPTNNSKKEGNPYVVYAHVDNYFSDYRNLKKIVDNYPNCSLPYESIRGSGAVFMPEEEFQRLIDLKDDKKVFVVDYNKFPDVELNKNGLYIHDVPRKIFGESSSLDDFIKFPQSVPFFGGEKLVRQYFEKHKEYFKRDKLGFNYHDDLVGKPVARFLALEGGKNSFGNFITYPCFSSMGRLITVKK